MDGKSRSLQRCFCPEHVLLREQFLFLPVTLYAPCCEALVVAVAAAGAVAVAAVVVLV